MGEVRMMVPRLREIAGRWFWRPSKSLREQGYKNIPLGSDAMRAVEKARALNARVKWELKSAPGPRFEPGSVGDLIRIYTADDRFIGLAASTRKTYMVVLREIERNMGDDPISAIERPHLREVYRQIKARGAGIARMHMVLWYNLMDLAKDEGWRTTNPASEMGISKGDARTRVWTQDELERFRATARAAGKASIALAVDLAYDLGQRPGDVLRLSWGQWDGYQMALTQSKRKAQVTVPAAVVRDQLNSMDRAGVQIVISEATGRPYTAHAFSGAFRRLRKLAGLPTDLQARDTRRTALTEAGDGGGTESQLQSLSGHKNRRSIESYVHPSSTMAADAQAARERARNRSGKIATIKGEK